MWKTRRTLLGAMAAVVGGSSVSRLLALTEQTPAPMPSPNAPRNQNVPGGLEGLPEGNHENAARNPQLQAQIAASVQLLFKLATELKEEADHTNLNTTFSLSFVKKAQQIEKLAKQIKERSKG